MEFTVILQQMVIAVSSIIVGTQVITAAIHGAFKIENPNVNHWISWIVAVLAGLGFVAFNGLTFNVGLVWDYVLGGACGLLAGGFANSMYDWPAVAKIFDAITAVFGKKVDHEEK